MNKTLIRSLPLLLVFSGLIQASPVILEHEVPIGVIRGEKVRLEVMSLSTGGMLQEMMLLYRSLGEFQFHSVPMKREGTLFYTEIQTASVSTGYIEYYFAYEGSAAQTLTLPEENPQGSPFRLRIAPARADQQDAAFEVVILCPVPDDVLMDDEVVVAASVVGGETDIDFSYSKLFVDEVEVSGAAVFADGIVTYVPGRLRPGRHYIELQLFTPSGELLSKKEWAFRVIQSQAGRTRFQYDATFFLDGRVQEVSGDRDNILRGGGSLTGDYGRLDLYTRIILSTEEKPEVQPVNRYSAELDFHISGNDHLYLHGGDFMPYYNPLTFQDKRVRGVRSGFGLYFLLFDFIYGQTMRGVEGLMQGDTLQVNGTYAENIMAFRPGFRFGSHGQWNFNLLNSKEKENSIEYGGNVKEAVIAGTDVSFNFDKKRILFEASVQASIKNSDAGGPELTFDQLVEEDSAFAEKAIYEKLFNWVKGSRLLSMTAGLGPYPSLAMQADLTLKYLNNHLKLSYVDIDNEFENPGNPYLLKDIRGFYVFDTMRFLKNQIYVNLFFKKYLNNLTELDFRTDNLEFGTTLSYFPFGPYPSLTLGFENYSHRNGVSEADTALYGYLYMEDNTTRRLSAASAYTLSLGKVNNTLSANVMNYTREDEAYSEFRSRYDAVTVGLNTRFPFPLTTRLGFSMTRTAIGDTAQTLSHVNRYQFRVEYAIRDFPLKGSLRPFVNLIWQQIESELPGEDAVDTDRLNYSAGLSFQTALYGGLILRYDRISYSLEEEIVDDEIFSARYEIHL